MRNLETFMTILIGLALMGTLASPGWTAGKPHAVFVVGTPHYSPQNSMPVLAKELERFGFRTTVILPNGNPERNKNGEGILGLEALKDADVAIFFMRFLTLNDTQFQAIMDYVESGKPVVGFRTSTHSFIYPEGHKLIKWNNGWGRDVLGTRYTVHQSGTTECRTVEEHKDHSILTGVAGKEFTSAGTLYLTKLQPGCVPLLLGTGKSASGDRLLENQFGTTFVSETETDIVAWTWTNLWGGRVFSTSLGHTGDFAVEPAVRTMINGICWAAGQPVPSAGARINVFEVEDAERKGK